MNHIIVTAPSALDKRLSPAWLQETKKELKADLEQVEIDLALTRQIDATGVAALLELSRLRRKSGERIRLINGNVVVLHTLEIMGMHREFEFGTRPTDSDSKEASPILIVEDEQIIRSVAAMVLKPLGRPIITAENGVEGLELAMRERPCLIVLDYMLPVMDGAEVLRQLKQSEDTRDIPVVIMSANARIGIGKGSEFPEAAAFFSKPFRTEGFRSEVAALISASLKVETEKEAA